MSDDEHPIVSAFGCLCLIVFIVAVIWTAGTFGLVPPGP